MCILLLSVKTDNDSLDETYSPSFACTTDLRCTMSSSTDDDSNNLVNQLYWNDSYAYESYRIRIPPIWTGQN